MHNSLIVGAGKLGKRFYHYLQSQNHNTITLSKTAKTWSENHIQLDLSSDFKLPELPKLSYVFIIVAPNNRTEQAYKNTYIIMASRVLAEITKQHPSVHCVFLSSTSIYGVQQKGVINETIAPQPDGFRGEVMLQAEASIKKVHDSVSIVRASGLYSKQRERLIQSLQDPKQVVNDKWMNLIHEDDLCYWLLKAADQKWPLSIASDSVAFQRQHLVKDLKILPDENYRQFKSKYLENFVLVYPSIMSWYKCQ